MKKTLHHGGPCTCPGRSSITGIFLDVPTLQWVPSMTDSVHPSEIVRVLKEWEFLHSMTGQRSGARVRVAVCICIDVSTRFFDEQQEPNDPKNPALKKT